MGLATMQYVQDYDQVYPCNTALQSATQKLHFHWMYILQPYTKSLDVFSCPDAIKLSKSSYGGMSFYQYAVGANEKIVNRVNSELPQQSVPEASVMRPAELPLLADADYVVWPSTSRVFNANWTGDFWAPPATPDATLARHNGGSNITYADGHSKWAAQGAIVNMKLDPYDAALQ